MADTLTDTSAAGRLKALDGIVIAALATRFSQILEHEGRRVSIPLSRHVYPGEQLRFDRLLGGPQARALSEFSFLVNDRPPAGMVWLGLQEKLLWQVYEDVMGARLADDNLTAEDRRRYQDAERLLFTPDGDPTPALRAHRARRHTGGGMEQARIEDALRTLNSLAARSPAALWRRHRAVCNPPDYGMSQDLNGSRYAPTYYSPATAVDALWTSMRLTRQDITELAGQAPDELFRTFGRDHDPTINSITFDWTVVTVDRPWLPDPVRLLGSRAYRLEGPPISDGAAPVPGGSFPSYVEQVVFARDILIEREIGPSLPSPVLTVSAPGGPAAPHAPATHLGPFEPSAGPVLHTPDSASTASSHAETGHDTSTADALAAPGPADAGISTEALPTFPGTGAWTTLRLAHEVRVHLEEGLSFPVSGAPGPRAVTYRLDERPLGPDGHTFRQWTYFEAVPEVAEIYDLGPMSKAEFDALPPERLARLPYRRHREYGFHNYGHHYQAGAGEAFAVHLHQHNRYVKFRTDRCLEESAGHGFYLSYTVYGYLAELATTPGDVHLAAFVARPLPACPNPDDNLHWT